LLRLPRYAARTGARHLYTHSVGYFGYDGNRGNGYIRLARAPSRPIKIRCAHLAPLPGSQNSAPPPQHGENQTRANFDKPTNMRRF